MKLKQIKRINQNDGYYFPLFNLLGLRSSITPFFAGDLKLDHHTYALKPTTELDLFLLDSSRDIVFEVYGQTYHHHGQTYLQQSDEIIYETDLLYQRVIRKNALFDIETTSYVPTDETVELHEVKLTNHTSTTLTIDIHTAIPLYGRSADNLRDHRHVTSLLNRIKTYDQGIMLKPTLSFDERGHQINQKIYSIHTASKDLKIKGFVPILDDYINGGSLLFPKKPYTLVQSGFSYYGYECFGGIFFEPIDLKPGQSISFYISLGIHDDESKAIKAHQRYTQKDAFHQGLKQTEQFFYDYINALRFNFHHQDTSKQLGWVMLQPMLRRFFGNSYMPHHDYGRGGRGWRDLWQDCLALIMTNDHSVYDLLINNFAGVRIDGSNATIIGDQPGEFKADRNQITRVWSDHGAWPLLTLDMYIHETNQLDMLMQKQTYFNDQYTHYTKKTRQPQTSTLLKNQQGDVYYGTIFEHLLIQNLVGIHNKGKHGFTRLEDADWNDGLDMAHDLGETIAFTHMYTNNLMILVKHLEKLNHQTLKLYEGVLSLLEVSAPLEHYFDEVATFSGIQVEIEKEVLIQKLTALYQERLNHIQTHGFMDTHYKSYYDNDGVLLDTPNDLNLTGQTMALLNLTATEKQAKLLADHTRKHLFDAKKGGYLLNTNYNKVMTNLGRAFGFAYGHKENGAMFSHMDIMYIYGLYQYNLIAHGHEGLLSILKRALDDESKVWVGIPEYFNDRGVGKYSYLTGSASWLLKLMRTEVFGIQLHYGALYLKPKLTKQDFINHQASIQTYIQNQRITITFHNPKSLDFNQYHIKEVRMQDVTITLPIQKITGNIEVYLDENI